MGHDITFLVGLPMGKRNMSPIVETSIDIWLTGSIKAGDLVQKSYSISNRVDWNRTNIMFLGKKLKTNVIMIDSDVIPETPYKEVKKYLFEDFNKGYDVVFAPMLTHDGNPQFNPMNAKAYEEKGIFPIYTSGFGFVAFSRRLVEVLQPIRYIDIITEMLLQSGIKQEEIKNIIKKLSYEELDKPINYQTYEKTLPMYFTYTTSRSEDIEFCERMLRQGIKMGVDTRIKVKHMTEVPFVFRKK